MYDESAPLRGGGASLQYHESAFREEEKAESARDDERAKKKSAMEDGGSSRRVLLAGAGFLADAYDLFVINMVLTLLREAYPADRYPRYAAPGARAAWEGAVASTALWGSIVGQLTFGALADAVGRRTTFLATGALVTLGALASACARETEGGAYCGGVYFQIALSRCLLGVGVGGEYPLSASVTAESAGAARRARAMAAVFSMQG